MGCFFSRCQKCNEISGCVNHGFFSCKYHTFEEGNNRCMDCYGFQGDNSLCIHVY